MRDPGDRPAPGPSEDGRFTLAITATFTAEPVEPALRFWMGKLDLPADVVFAPYHQVFQQLLDPTSLLGTNRKGINVVMIRLEDWANRDREGARHSPDAGGKRGIEQAVHQLIRALGASVEASATPHVVCFCPASPLADHPACDAAEARAAAELAGIDGVHVVTSAELASLYPVADYSDPRADTPPYVPYTPLFFTALGTMVARKVYALKTAPAKVVVLDCDGTLWDGVVGEDGPDGIRFDPVRIDLQHFMVRQHDAGRLLCLCSRNNEREVLEVFDLRAEMPLKREHIVASRINWAPKPANLKSLAEELRLGLESFVMVDDDPVACAEIQAHCPEVMTLLLPRDPAAIAARLGHMWAFDHLKPTAEGRARPALYRASLARDRAQREVLTLEEFIAGLDLRVRVAPMAPHQVGRVAELTQRTNQFNLNPVKRSEPELKALVRSERAEVLVVEAQDRFGDYGLVGVIGFEPRADALLVDTFLLSCRALGRGVEHRMLSRLGELARARNVPRIDLRGARSGRNQPAWNFVEGVGGRGTSTPEGVLVTLAADTAALVSYRPEASRGGATPSDDGGRRPASAPEVSGAPARSALLGAIAETLHAPHLIHQAIFPYPTPRQSDAAFVAPSTPLEAQLADMYAQLLSVDQIGVNDGFFALGGHSLLAMQLLGRIQDTFKVELSTGVFFTTNLTVAELAQAILKEQARPSQPQEVADLLKKLAALTDEEAQAMLQLPASHGRSSPEVKSRPGHEA